MTAFWQFVINGIVAGALVSVVAMGIAIIYGGTRDFHIAHAGVFLFGGYVAQYLAIAEDVPVYFALIVGVIGSIVLGVLIDRVIYSSLEQRGGGTISIFLSSLGLLYVISNLLVIWRGPDSQYVTAPKALRKPISLGGPTLTGLQIILIVGAVLLLIALLVLLRFTRLGALIRALSSNPEQINISGRRVSSARILVYAIGSTLAGLAGIYTLLATGIAISQGEEYFMLAFVAVILGGIGSVQGAFIVALLLGLIENVVQEWVSNQWAEPIVFGAFLVTIVLSPRGLAAIKLRRPNRARASVAVAQVSTTSQEA